MKVLRHVLGVVATVCLLIVAGSGVAVAAPGEFGSGGDGAGQLNEPHGVAIEQESGDVYVADRNNNRAEKFSGEGEFLFAWGWGVADGSTNASQTCTTVCFAGSEGAGAGQLNGPEGVAVDNDPLSPSYRAVYVIDRGNRRVEKFDAAGNFVLMFGGEVNEETKGDVCLAGETCGAGTAGTEPGEFEPVPSGIAVDAAGTVYVGDTNRVQEFSPGGVYAGQMTLAGAGGTTALAVDSSGDVYVASSELSGVRKYDSSGSELGEPRDASGQPQAITLGAAGELFVDDGEEARGRHRILEYVPAGGEVASFDSAGDEGGSRGIAFGENVGELYVLNAHTVRLVSPPPPGPLVVAESTSELQPTTATVNAVLNPEGHATTYQLEYGTSASYGSSSAPTPLAGSAFEDEPVSVALSELQPRTTYHFRVLTSSSAGTIAGPDETFTTLAPALIDGESVSGVTARSASLAAQLNPLGRDTSYRFEYGPGTAYGSAVPVPDGDAGSGSADVTLSALVEGLSPSTVYHYRVVASNPLGTVAGADHVFVTQSGEAPTLPDGRAWELVSPPDKRGIALEGITEAGGLIQASADGGAIAYVAAGPIDAEPQGNRSIAVAQQIARRTAGGWSSADITTPHEAVYGLYALTEYKLFSPDLSVGLVEPEGDAPLSPQASERTPYLRDANGEYTPLVTAANVPPGVKFGQLQETGVRGAPVPEDAAFVTATPDLEHVILASTHGLTADVADIEGSSLENVFEWAGGSLRLVSILPNGRPATEEGATATVGQEGPTTGNLRHAVSDDGSRVFWRTLSTEVHLYMRDMIRGETVQLDAPEAGARKGAGGPVFATASGDGSKVFFTDASRLTRDSTALPGEKPDLYMCEIRELAGKLACALRDLTVDRNAGESANVQGTVIGASEDGRYVYFRASGVLASGATPGDCLRTICNLYVYDTVAGEVRFVAALASGDLPAFLIGTPENLARLTAGVSPDGRFLAFMSQRSLTGYDNVDVRSGQSDEEVFLYDASTGHLLCASCDPTGARPHGVFEAAGTYPGLLVDRPLNWEDHWLAGSIPGWTSLDQAHALYRSRYLSDSGRLFFNGADGLVPQDVNGKEDVYEFEPGGVGGCGREAGCVGLISSGTSGEESAFLDASETGNDAFFVTAARLAPQDVDAALDVYDAKVCSSSSPCLATSPASAPPCASADACRAPSAAQPGVFGAPPSATFSGAGNIAQGRSKPAAKSKAPTAARRFAVALRKCRAKPRRKRAACEANARRSYRKGVRAKRSPGTVATSKGKR